LKFDTEKLIDDKIGALNERISVIESNEVAFEEVDKDE
tara:strand:+ start:649 stop:762 length:114 start_codon:yes stop_codon:yes gene_type:complete